jgi:hypothetical protein
VDPTNIESIVDTLQIPSTDTYTIASDHGKRLKLVAPLVIMDKAYNRKLSATLVVLKEKAREIIRELEKLEGNSKEINKELRYKKP